MWGKSLNLFIRLLLRVRNTPCCCSDAGKNGSVLSMSFCASHRGSLGPPPRSLRESVHPQPAQQGPVHPGSHVQFPAALRQKQWQCQPPQDNHRREGFGEVQRGVLASPGELAYFVCVLRLVEIRQQPVLDFEALVQPPAEKQWLCRNFLYVHTVEVYVDPGTFFAQEFRH